MKVFACSVCGNLTFFENTVCVQCGRVLGFHPEKLALLSLEPTADGLLRDVAQGASETYRSCANGVEHAACNWLVASGDENPLCVACRLNKLIPNLTEPGNVDRWRRLEKAKRRLLYTLLSLELPIGPPSSEGAGMTFQFLTETPGGPSVLTGHEHGVITISLAEADDVEREARRISLGEPYRTLLGHFRHESGHYYWERLIQGRPAQAEFRECFGDERPDYGEALKAYYGRGPRSDWNDHFLSAYASSHPWEDWAETWHHYLQVVDTVDTAAAFGMNLAPDHPAAAVMEAHPVISGKRVDDFDQLLNNWLPLTYALNCLNRGAGLSDLYPFVLSTEARTKLRFVHSIVGRAAAGELQEDSTVEQPEPILVK